MPQIDEVPTVSELKSTALLAGLQDGVSVAISGQNIIDLVLALIGDVEVLGNAVTALNADSVAWKAIAGSNSPGANVVEARLPDDTLVGALGTSFDDTCEGFASVVNAIKVPVWDGGVQNPDALSEVSGMAPGDLMYYEVDEGS